MKPLHMLMGLFAMLPGTAFAQDGEKRAFDGVQVGVSVDRHTLDGDYKVANFDTKLDESKAGWSYDVSGRVCVLPTSNIMLYGRAGYRWLRVDKKTDFRDVKRLDIENSGTKKGLLLGAGVEAAVTSGATARAEYNQTNFGEGLK